MLTFGDIYAGAGLFSEGFRQAGFEPRFAVEIDREAVKSYKRNVGPHAIHASATEVGVVEKVNVLIAGPPCQGFSTLGRMDPLDVRNNLCLAVLPWIDAVDPNVVVVENVPPFLRSRHWALLSKGLKKRGYTIDTWELDAADFGTPQLRRRAFTVASRIGHVPPPSLHSNRIDCGWELLRRPIPENDPMHIWPIPSDLARQRIALLPANGDKRDILRVAPELCPPSWRKIGCQATDVWGRIDPSQPANTVRCTFQNPSKGRYLHPIEDRVISLREGARLQGIPDHWILEGKPYPVARQIGNGVPIPLAKAVGMAVRQAFGTELSRHLDCAA